MLPSYCKARPSACSLFCDVPRSSLCRHELYSKAAPLSSQHRRLRTDLKAVSGNGSGNTRAWVEVEHEDASSSLPELDEDASSSLQEDNEASPGEETFALNEQMLSALESRNTQEAWRICELLMMKKHKPSPVCLSRLVSQLSYAGTPSSLTKAQTLVATLQKRRSASLLDCNSLGLLAMATSKAGAVRYAASIIRLILKLGYLPHVKAWSAVVSKLGKDREDVPLALSLFEDICSMAEKAESDVDNERLQCSANAASSMRPDTGAFNASLNACANACLADKANEIFNGLSKFGLRPDELTFNIMIKLYALSNNKSKLSEVLFEMETAGVKPCMSTMHSLVAAYVGLDELDRAVMIVEALRKGKEDISRILTSDLAHLNALKIIPTTSLDSADSSLVDTPLPVPADHLQRSSSSKKRRLNDVKQLLVAMQNQDDAGSLPNEVTYTTVITTCVRLGLLDEARSFLREMASHKVPANVITYNVLLKGYSDACQATKGRLLLEDMKKAGIQPDVISFNILIDGYINADDSTSALAMYTQMREAGIAPSKQTYTNLIKAFGKNRQPELAAKIFQEMERDRRVKIDTIAWNALIDAYCRVGHVEGAKGAFQRMKEFGYVPTVATYGSLVKGFANRGKVGEALVLWKEIQERLEAKESNGVPLKPDAGLLDGLVDICVRARFFMKALEIVACMEKHQIPADKIKYQRMFVELHSKLYTSPHTSQSRRDRSAARRRAVEAFKFWVGLPNTGDALSPKKGRRKATAATLS
ncbi:hypothetical protein GOP47_0009786 [Adiantum capillus-veneris]|uniref:Pentatricopeptide repeat-containing protein n=1 Tax=Adiantum capillus-veneris TaxID=13818 RepID=A0A9D4UXN9_ADICA|nr:hypothetical protein GOP47_0009786 [Adiantum capillus-veneris]